MSLCMFGKGETTKAPQGHAFIYTAVLYSILSLIFSVIACLSSLSVLWAIIIHSAILAVFVIRAITLTAGSEYINKVEQRAEQKHAEFKKEKADYWK